VAGVERGADHLGVEDIIGAATAYLAEYGDF
jgi:hypothetical protein